VAGGRSASGSLTAHSRAAWRARRRTISISAAGAELSTFVLFVRTETISRWRWQRRRAPSIWPNRIYFWRR
jgi:hypothetical protein